MNDDECQTADDWRKQAADWRQRALASEQDAVALCRTIANQERELERYRSMAQTLEAERAEKAGLLDRQRELYLALYAIQDNLKRAKL